MKKKAPVSRSPCACLLLAAAWFLLGEAAFPSGGTPPMNWASPSCKAPGRRRRRRGTTGRTWSWAPGPISAPTPTIKANTTPAAIPTTAWACTDVIWQAFRAAGYSLKDLVDADIAAHPEYYPNIETPDGNIDFRRVSNLDTFFRRHAQVLTCELDDPAQWQPGDIVIFGDRDHIGICPTAGTGRGSLPHPPRKPHRRGRGAQRHGQIRHYRPFPLDGIRFFIKNAVFPSQTAKFILQFPAHCGIIFQHSAQGRTFGRCRKVGRGEEAPGGNKLKIKGEMKPWLTRTSYP
ncbi:MAG: DUF1287 domain-containing protein [Oscillospiraceae bacterium]